MQLDNLLDTLQGHYDEKLNWSLLEDIWRQERWFDARRQEAAMRLVQEALLAEGLSDATVDDMPADGRTRYQDWVAPMAWDCDQATLAMADTGHILADRQQNPCNTVMCSAPLPPTTAEVVDGDALGTITPDAVNGKWVLTANMATQMKQQLRETRAVGVVSDFLAKGIGFGENDVKWINSWSDAADGWYFHADDQPLTGFSISPAQGRILRSAMAGGKPVKLHGHCDARLYEGRFQNLTATIPGRDGGRELWLYAHSAEQGAADNCSGCATVTGAMILIRRLIDRGVLPPPRHTIRMILMPECVGMMAFATHRDAERRRALAGLYLDQTGERREDGRAYTLSLASRSNPSFAWAMAGLLCERVAARNPKHYTLKTVQYVFGGDDVITDPLCDVPSTWMGTGAKDAVGYHSSLDTPAICSHESLRCNGLMSAAWAYASASLNDHSASEVLGEAVGWIDRHVVRGDQDAQTDAGMLRRWSAGRMVRSLGQFGISPSVFEQAASRYASADAPPLPDLPTDGPIYRRCRWGPATFESIPLGRRKWSRWSGIIASALFWTDGQRSVPAVNRLVKAETNQNGPGDDLYSGLLEADLAERVR